MKLTGGVPGTPLTKLRLSRLFGHLKGFTLGVYEVPCVQGFWVVQRRFEVRKPLINGVTDWWDPDSVE